MPWLAAGLDDALHQAVDPSSSQVLSLFIVIAAGNDEYLIFLKPIDQTMLSVDMTAPKTGELMFQRLRVPYPLIAVARDVIKKPVDPP